MKISKRWGKYREMKHHYISYLSAFLGGSKKGADKFGDKRKKPLETSNNNSLKTHQV